MEQQLSPQTHAMRRWLVGLGFAAVVWTALFSQLQPIADGLTYGVLGLDPASAFGSALNFFVYDVPKILLLLGGMIFLVTLLQTFISPHQVRDLINRTPVGVANLLAALFGALTPFCSCSSVPLFIGFVEAGVPLGVTFSFLITSPIMNEVAFVLLIGMFGWQAAVLYLISGIVIGVVSGMILGRMKLERYVEPFVYRTAVPTGDGVPAFAERLTWPDRFERALDATREIVSKVWPYVMAGIAIGAFIHGFVPEDALAGLMGKDTLWSVPAAVLIGVPLYSNAAGVIPIVSALMDKGAALGTALAFMMAVVALSLPEIIILRRVLKPRLIAIFVAVVSAAIMLTGYLFNSLFV